MASPSFTRRKDKAAAAEAADDGGTLQQARAQARRRLIGAVVLLAVGVILFPILFETQPRPIPADIPIQVARKDGGLVTVAPPPTLKASPASAPVPAVEPRVEPVAVASAPAPAAASLPAGTDSKAVEPPAASKPEPKAEPKPAAASAPLRAASAPPAKPASAPPAPALATASAVAASQPAAGRFVVQVGAFTDNVAMREARQKVEKLGLRTYTQVIETDSGRRTRVRVGPFETRDEADKASVKLKGAGLPAYILVL